MSDQALLDALPEDRTVTWGESTFEIRKMLPVEAKRVFIHHVRPLLAGAAEAPQPPGMRRTPETDANGEPIPTPGFFGETEQWRVLLSAFTNASGQHYDALSKAMSRSILVRRGAEQRFLAGHEEWAFQGLEGVSIRSFWTCERVHRKFSQLVFRSSVRIPSSNSGVKFAEPKNIDPFFANLVAADFGLKFSDFEARKPNGDPLIDLSTCADYHEILLTRAVNRERAERAAEARHRKQSRRRR